MKELEYPFNPEEILKKKKSLKRQLLSSPNTSFLEKRIAILGGSTTNDVKNILELFLLNYGIKPSFYESEYNRYYEDAVFPNPALEAFAPDVIYFHTSNRNITEYPTAADSAEAVAVLCDAVYQRYESMWNRVQEAYHCTIIQNNFEPPFFRLYGNQDASDIHGRTNFINRLNERFYEYARKHENFFIHDIAYEAASYGLEKWSDPFYWHMYKYAMCVPAIPYTAFGVANIIKSVFGKNKKALCLDLDNTLWGGVIGDDGAENIEIGQETSMGQVFGEFQEYLKLLKERGILLTINSKNEKDTALSGLRRPDSVLKEEDFVAVRANWNPKDRNLAEIAEELQLLPESFVFVDDNPAERKIVEDGLRGVSVPELDRPEHFIEILDRSGYFEVTSLSEDDLKRSRMYRENAERVQAQSACENYDEYLKSLEMRGTIKQFEPMYMSRIAQLTNKSNQFNLTTKRYSQGEIEEAAQDRARITLYGKLEDRFGDNGVVSVVIGRIQEKELHIELWLMSCRVLKREMEYAMMDELVEKCRRAGIDRIYGYYYPTAKNGMVKDFYELQGFDRVSVDEQGNTVWLYELGENYEKKNRVIKVNVSPQVKRNDGTGTEEEEAELG